MSREILQPERGCWLCPRLAQFRQAQEASCPTWFNAPVPAFGLHTARLLIVGLAPGLRGANRTGRPFTGDYAGELLYPTLIKFSLANGVYGASLADGLRLNATRVSNAVRCVPPANKPTSAEISCCNQFLRSEIEGLPHLRAVLALGRVAHEAVLTATGMRPRSHYAFKHGACHPVGKLRLFDSYHCSRYNTNTGVLTTAMFESVVGEAAAYIQDASV